MGTNFKVCFCFVVMLISGVAMLKDINGRPEMVVALITFCFLFSAWFFMDGLLSAIRSAQPKVEKATDAETTTFNQ